MSEKFYCVGENLENLPENPSELQIVQHFLFLKEEKSEADKKLRNEFQAVETCLENICKKVAKKVHRSNTRTKLKRLIERYKRVRINHKRHDSASQQKNASEFLVTTFSKPFSVSFETEKMDIDNEGLDDDDDDDVEMKDDIARDPDFLVPDPKPKIVRTAAEKLLRDAMSSQEVTATTDRYQVSDNACVQIVAAIARSAKLDVKKATQSRSTFRFNRIENRSLINSKVDHIFIEKVKRENIKLTVHWDGKMVPNSTNDGTQEVLMERLPIVVTGNGVEKTLSVPKITSGTGEAQANAVWEVLVEYGVAEYCVALSFDTTSSNTGRFKGACVLLDSNFPQNLLHLACRHHCYEVFCASAFQSTLGTPDGPSIGLQFENLRKNWLKIGKKKITVINFKAYKPKLRKILMKMRDEALLFLCQADLQNLRGDYLEAVQCAILLLGGTVEGFSFKTPQGMSKARWMCRLLYAFKEFLLQKELNLSKDYLAKLQSFVLFGSLLYIKRWIRAGFAADAALIDLELRQEIEVFKQVDIDLYDAVVDKFLRHTWYLSGELIGLSLFSELVSIPQKSAIITKLIETESDWSKRSTKSTSQTFLGKELADFVDSTTRPALEGLGIDIQCLITLDPINWPLNPAYVEGKAIVAGLSVMNDAAERSVRLATQFNNFATKNESQKQEIFKNVEFVRKRFPNSNLNNLATPLFPLDINKES